MTQESAIRRASIMLQILFRDDKDICASIRLAEKEKDTEFLSAALEQMISGCKTLLAALNEAR